MPSRRSTWAAVLGATALLAPPAGATDIAVTPWTPQFLGIDAATASYAGSTAHLERIDLWAPGIRVTVTPPSGGEETVSETTSQFLLATGVQLAFNTNYFMPCCDAVAAPKTLTGLSVSDGALVSPQAVETAQNQYDADGASSLLFARGIFASIVPPTTAPLSLAGVWNAVSGYLIVSAGQNVVVPSEAGPHDPTTPDARTAVGLSRNDRYLYVAATDGRDGSAGVTTSQAADLMVALGAYEALNLDGAGSTTLVRSDGAGGAQVLNHPQNAGGVERYVGSNLGVFALPLPAVPRR